jgi:hypothetical protein
MLSSTFRGFDELGDMSSMSIQNNEVGIFSSKYQNLLSLGGGKGL